MKSLLVAYCLMALSLSLSATTIISESVITRFDNFFDNFSAESYIKLEGNTLSYSLWITDYEYFLTESFDPEKFPTHFELFGTGGFSETFALTSAELVIINGCVERERLNPFITYAPVDPSGLDCSSIEAFGHFSGQALPVNFSEQDLPPELSIIYYEGDERVGSGVFTTIIPEPSIFLLSSLFSFHLLSRRRRMRA